MKMNNLNLKLLIRAHIILGLFTVFFFYLATFFGSLTLFMPYIKAWESPSRHFSIIQKKIDLDEILPEIIKKYELEDNIEITLASFRDKALSINDKYSRTIYINPNNKKVLNTRYEDAFLSEFLNEIHIGRNIPKIGVILMGIASILMIFLCISGFIMFIFNKKKKSENFYFKWHKNLTLYLLPFILVFALTGAVLGFMLGNSQPLAYAASKSKTSNLRELVAPILFPRDKIEKSLRKEQMLKISILEKKAKIIYPDLKILQIKLFSWQKKNAQIKFLGYLKNDRILSGRVNRMHIILSAVNGQIINKKDLSNANTSNKILSAFYFLHFIPDEGIIIRLVFFVLSFFMAISLAFGFLIYTLKKAKYTKDDKNYYEFLNTLALSIMFGIIPSTCLLFFLSWFLAFDLYERETWIQGLFYVLWAFTLLYSLLLKNALKTLKHFSLLSAFLLFFSIIFHIKNSFYSPWDLWNNKIYDVFYVDLFLFLFGLVFLSFYFKIKDKKKKNV